MDTNKLTEFQVYALKKIKDEHGENWFVYTDCLGLFDRAEFVCETLHRKGKLNRKMNPKGMVGYEFWSYQVKS